MAVVKIWKIETRLDRTIDYAEDKKKTENTDYKDMKGNQLQQVIDYAMNEYKTEKQYYTTGINCSTGSAYEEMMITKKQFNKTNGILGFHAYQSFKGHEVSPEIAHEVGLKLAEEMWGDRFEVVVTTHLNSNNIHNHFVINSVSFVDGKKYYDNRYTYAELRNTSDNLCREYGISVLEEKACTRSKINYGNYCKSSEKRSTYCNKVKQDVDRAIEQAYSYNDFENLLKAMDYKLTYRAGNLSVCKKPYKRNIRISRVFGNDYIREKIEKRIKETVLIDNLQYKKSNKPHRKVKGMKALYLYYCYLLKIFPNKKVAKKIPASIRADVYKLDEISRESELLSENNINTYEEFLKYKTNITNDLEKKKEIRSRLWNKIRSTNNRSQKSKMKSEIDEIAKDIILLTKEERLCFDIENRVNKIENNIKEFERGKERSK